VRSVLAPTPFSRAGPAGVAAVVVLGLFDIAMGAEIVFATLLVLPPLFVALTGRWGDTTVVALSSLGVVLSSPLWIDGIDAESFYIPLVLVLAGGVVAMAAAIVRFQTEVALARFGLLVGVADAGERSVGSEALVEALLDVLVPAFGDVASLEALRAGEQRRLGVRIAPGVAPDVADQLGSPDSRTSGVSVPLRARGDVFGRLSCATDPSGRRYSAADERFAVLLAGRVSLTLDNAGLTTELTAAEEQLGAVVRTLAEAVTMTDLEGNIVYANEAAVDLLRVDSVDDLLNSDPGAIMSRFAVYDDEGRPVDLRDLPGSRVLAGEPDAEPVLVRNIVRATGEERWLLNKVSSLRDEAGNLLRVVNVIEDVTEVKRAERAQRLLARASEVLSSSFDYEETLQRVAEIAVPTLADWAAVDMLGRGGMIEQVAVAHSDPERVALAHRLRESYPVRDSDAPGLPAVIRHGRSEVQHRIPDEALVAYAEDEEHLRMLREVGFGSLMMVPLQAGSETLGALTFVNSDPARAFGDAELQLAQELGRRAGVAVLNSRLYSRRTEIARALQHGLMPPELPDVPGWSAAVLYRPAGELNEVGGDFYDIFEGPDGWMLVIGDIAGQGAEAATRTSLARFTARTAAELTGDVSRAIGQLNETLRGQSGLPLCTIVCGSLKHTSDGGAQLTMASAGHPPPLLVRGGEVIPVGDPGTIAGAFDGEQWPSATVELIPGDTLVFYTDGVIDAVGEHDRYGEARLHETLKGLEGSVDGRLAALGSQLTAFQRGPQRDDTTVLVLQLQTEQERRAAAVAQVGEAPAR
jgi:serine phosphatase RsbU (regulator of sigma subunit)/PAS domain-containing protein